MKTLLPAQAPARMVSRSRGALLQRKCPCGGKAGLNGQCEDCARRKQLGVQAKLIIGASGDRYEREADHAAALAVRGALVPALTPLRPSAIRRQGAAEQTETAGSAAGIVGATLANAGTSLDPTVRDFMEARFGHRFGHVRIHADARAAASARSLQARAYTVGTDIVFGSGQYVPTSNAGRHLIAHELAHVVQQSGAPGAAVLQRAAPAAAVAVPIGASGPAGAVAAAVAGVALVGYAAYAGGSAAVKWWESRKLTKAEARQIEKAQATEAVRREERCPYPTGLTPKDAIPMEWHKLAVLYPSPIRLGDKDYHSGVLDHLPSGDEIGISPRFWPYVGKPLQLRDSRRRSRAVSARFRRVLAAHGFYWGARRYLQADHVQDLQWGSPDGAELDTFRNLWPLDGAMNVSAGATQNINQPISYCETKTGPAHRNVRLQTLKDRGGWGRYFYIGSIDY